MTDPMISATEALRRIHAGRLTPAVYRDACLARIAAQEPTIRAFADFDPVRVRQTAPQTGRLAGMPIGVKDVLDTAAQPSQYGSPIWQGYQPRADAACVAAAKAAGASVMGKTVTTEFATRTPGPTANPHNTAHTPGGSSSGSAAGVAAGFFPFAFGTQTAGSIIRPAAFCGVVGYKPSFGMIGRMGMKLMSESLDTIGVIARSVADCALLAGVVAQRDLGDPDLAPSRAPRIGLCRSPGTQQASAETLALLERVAGILSAAGAAVRDFTMPSAFLALESAQPLVMNSESARNLAWELSHHRQAISDVLLERLDWGLSRTEDELHLAHATMDRLQTAFPAALGDLDILLTPSAPGEAPEGLTWTGDPAFNLTWTALHVPCVTIPAGQGPAGLPLGVQIVGPRWADTATLAWAGWVARTLGA